MDGRRSEKKEKMILQATHVIGAEGFHRVPLFRVY